MRYAWRLAGALCLAGAALCLAGAWRLAGALCLAGAWCTTRRAESDWAEPLERLPAGCCAPRTSAVWLKAPAWLAAPAAGPADAAVAMPAVATAATAAAPSVTFSEGTFSDGRRTKRLKMVWIWTGGFGKVIRGVKVCLC